MRWLYKLLSLAGHAKAAARGPAPLVRRLGRSYANRRFNRALRRVLKP